MKRIQPGPAARRAGAEVHTAIPDLLAQAKRGVISRREFIRYAALLGLPAAAAFSLVGAKSSVAREAITGSGGRLRVSMKVQAMDDPARFDWTEKSNIARHFVEYLTITGPDNLTRPYIAERWRASEDLRTWTFQLRKEVQWSNGDDFTAEDVVFNFRRWVDPKTGSSNKSLFSGLSATGIERVDAHTVRIHLKTPELAIPENLYNYPAAIVHRRFVEEGSDLSRNPVGTGPYKLAEFRVGEKAVLVKREPASYWGPAVSLDRIDYIDHGDDPLAGLGAIASGQADLMYEVSPDQIEMAWAIGNVKLYEAVTAQTAVARMRVDTSPFDKPALRRAIQACIDHSRLLELGYRGRGAAGEDHHVAPIHPEYAKLPPQRQDYDLAKRLLGEAGYPDGVTLAIDCRSAPTWESATVQAIAAMCRPVNIRLNIKVMPSEQYGDIWNKTTFGFTAWSHRPLGVMALNLAYRSGAAWNETRYANPAFDKALNAASGVLDPAKRRTHIKTCERILQNDAVIVQPLWRSIFTVASRQVENFQLHPANYHQFGRVRVR